MDRRGRRDLSILEWGAESIQEQQGDGEFTFETMLDAMEYLSCHEKAILRFRQQGLRQIEIAEKLGVGQSGIAHCLHRILFKVQWNNSNKNPCDRQEMNDSLQQIFTDPAEINWVIAWIERGNMLQVSKQFGIDFSTVRWRVCKAIKKLSKVNKPLQQYMQKLFAQGHRQPRSTLGQRTLIFKEKLSELLRAANDRKRNDKRGIDKTIKRLS